MQGGGQDRQWYEPLAPDGTRDLDIAEETIGCHVGPYAGLNVGRPQPGFEYRWAINDPKELLRVRMQGAQVVQAEDPEFSVFNDFTDPDRTPLDTSQLYAEVILTRTPIEMVRERRLQEQRKAEIMVHGSASDFIDRASSTEADYGRRDGGGATRFSRSEHMTEYEEDGKPAAVWTPDSGIVRR
jgi:hypothetical protein